MLTSTEEAQSCVNSLRNRIPRNPSVLIGHFRLHDNYVYRKKSIVLISTQNTKRIFVNL